MSTEFLVLRNAPDGEAFAELLTSEEPVLLRFISPIVFLTRFSAPAAMYRSSKLKGSPFGGIFVLERPEEERWCLIFSMNRFHKRVWKDMNDSVRLKELS